LSPNYLTKNLNISLYEAFFTSLVVGLAETYFIAYALHLGVSVIQSGLLSSFPLLLAGLSPFFFRRLFRRFSNSKWVLVGCGMQAFAIASLAFLGAFSFGHSPSFSFSILLVLFSIYWFGHFSCQPSWNKWIAEIVPHAKSQSYFSKRSRVVQIGTITGLVLGGFSLHLEIFNVSTTLLFIMLFLLAYHIKMLSFYFFYKLPKSNTAYDISWQRAWSFFKRHRGFFTIYSIFNFSLYLSAPFVSGYLLSVRGLSYQSYMWVMAAFFVGKIVTTFFLDRLKFEITPHHLYFSGALLAAPIPAFWPVCDTLYSLCLLHFASGLGWSAWEVGMSLTVFKKIHADEKIEAVTIYNMIGLPTQVLGTVVSAVLLVSVYHNSYTMMFVVAGITRFLMIIPMYFKKFGEN
jgi:MFS family permease